MARTTLTVTDATTGGADVVYNAADATNGNIFTNSGSDYILVKNDSASSVDVTVVSVPCSHGRTQDEVKAVAAGATAMLGTFPVSLFGSDVQVDFSADTSVTVAVVR